MQIYDEIWKIISHNTSKQDEPIGFVLGGQPGAGKSKLIQNIVKQNSNIVVINADEFRKYHPDYVSFQEQNDKEAQSKTAEFIAQATQYLINKAINNKHNLIVEGTFRTANTPIQTLKILKQSGYKTCVNVLITSKEISWSSCVERYEKAIRFKRYTPKEHHDIVIKNIAHNIDEVIKSKMADCVEIFLRDFNDEMIKIYDANTNIYDANLINSILNTKTKEQMNEIISHFRQIR